MYDSVKAHVKIADKKSTIMKRHRLSDKSYILATMHRASNTDDKNSLKSIINTLLASKEKINMPLHPRTEKFLRKFNLYKILKRSYNIILTEPLGYFDILTLENNAKKIITDSGGIQKEAYFLKISCITLRNETEWVETVKDKWNILVGNNSKKLLNAIKTFEPKTKQHNYFGNGNAAKNIVAIINNL